MEQKRISGDMTTGRPLKLILLFSIPVLLGNIFQQLYNVTDASVISHTLGDEALAAVGATGPVYSLIINLAYGITCGFSVIIARYFGQKNIEKMKKAVAMSLLLTFIFAIILTIVSLLTLRPLLEFLETPEEIIDRSMGYLKIVLGFCIVTLFYNAFAGMLRGIGNSRAPLYFLMISACLNVGLDLLFVSVFHMGINGVAIATVIAQSVSVITCLIYIRVKCPLLLVSFKDFKMDKAIFKDLITMGLSMGFMLALVCVGSVALQRAVNSFGSDTIAAHTAARRIDEIAMMPFGTISIATSTFVSQNFGVGNFDRIKKGVKDALLIAGIWAVIANIIIFSSCHFMVLAITGTNNSFIVKTACKYMYINVPFFFVLLFLLVLRNALQSVNRKLIPVIASIIELISKFLATGLLAPKLGYLGVCIAEPIIWTLCGIIVLIAFLSFLKKCKKPEVESIEVVEQG